MRFLNCAIVGFGMLFCLASELWSSHMVDLEYVGRVLNIKEGKKGFEMQWLGHRDLVFSDEKVYGLSNRGKREAVSIEFHSKKVIVKTGDVLKLRYQNIGDERSTQVSWSYVEHVIHRPSQRQVNHSFSVNDERYQFWKEDSIGDGAWEKIEATLDRAILSENKVEFKFEYREHDSVRLGTHFNKFSKANGNLYFQDDSEFVLTLDPHRGWVRCEENGYLVFELRERSSLHKGREVLKEVILKKLQEFRSCHLANTEWMVKTVGNWHKIP